MNKLDILERIAETVKYYINAETEMQMADAIFQMNVAYDEYEMYLDEEER